MYKPHLLLIVGVLLVVLPMLTVEFSSDREALDLILELLLAFSIPVGLIGAYFSGAFTISLYEHDYAIGRHRYPF